MNSIYFLILPSTLDCTYVFLLALDSSFIVALLWSASARVFLWLVHGSHRDLLIRRVVKTFDWAKDALQFLKILNFSLSLSVRTRRRRGLIASPRMLRQWILYWNAGERFLILTGVWDWKHFIIFWFVCTCGYSFCGCCVKDCGRDVHLYFHTHTHTHKLSLIPSLSIWARSRPCFPKFPGSSVNSSQSDAMIYVYTENKRSKYQYKTAELRPLALGVLTLTTLSVPAFTIYVSLSRLVLRNYFIIFLIFKGLKNCNQIKFYIFLASQNL